jgi:hypothetical protein
MAGEQDRPIRVEVEGVGVVEFPAGTPPGKITAALQTARGQVARGGRTWGDTLADVGIGMAKGLGEGVVNAGKLWHAIPGVSRAVDTLYGQPGLSAAAMREADAAMEATNTPQGVGKFAEQVGETLLAGPAILKAGSRVAQAAGRVAPRMGQPAADLAGRVAVEAAAGGGLAAYQGGDATTGAVLGGAIPGIGAGVRAARNAVLGGVQHTPEMARAVAFGAREGVPLDAATATGRNIVGVVQKRVSDSMGGAGIAEKFQEAQAEALARTGRKLAGRVSDEAASPEQAGTAVRERVQDVIRNEATAADEAYGRVRAAERNAMPDDVPVTRKAGDATVSATEPMQFAVPLAPAKDALRPVFERLMRKKELTGQLMGDEARAATALDALISGPDNAPLSVVDAALGDLKAAARGAAMPELRSQGQGLAAQAVAELETLVQQRAKAAGVWDDLRAGRDATIAKWTAAETLEALRTEPVGVFNAAVTARDAGIAKLREVAKLAPGEMPKIGRAYVEQLLDTATAEGGFARAQGLMAQWQKLGPETKKLLFPNPLLREDLDNFFLLAKKIGENPNPSGTARVMTAFNVMNTVPAYMLAKVLYSPAGVRQLTKGIATGNPSAVATALGRVTATQAAQVGQ